MRRLNTSGFSLIEVTLALGVASFSMLAIFGLLPVGVISNQTSIQQTLATNIATGIVADLKQVPPASAIAASSGALTAISSTYGVDVSKAYASASPRQFYVDESGSLLPNAAGARYSVNVTLAQSGSRQAADGMITIAWPAGAVRPLDHVSVFLALDRN